MEIYSSLCALGILDGGLVGRSITMAIWRFGMELLVSALRFVSFFKLFAIKNVKISYFNHPLECAAPKPRSKYTTK